MFRLSNSSFLRYIETTFEPIHVEIYTDPADPIFFTDHLKEFFSALNKNKNSTELIISDKIRCIDSSSLINFIKSVKIPSNITTIELPKINYDTHTGTMLKLHLQPHIVNLKLNSLTDLFNIDYSENNNLRTITAVFNIHCDKTFAKIRNINDICFAHFPSE